MRGAGRPALLLMALCLGPIRSAAAAVGPDPPPASWADCDARVRSRPTDYYAYECFLALTRAGRPRGEAVRRLEGYLAFKPDNHLARVVLARVEKDAGQSRAEPLFREAADGFAAAKMPVGEVFARIDLANFLEGRGRHDEAEDQTGRAMRAAEAAGVAGLVDSVRSMQASLAYNRADYAAAYMLFRKLETDFSDRTPRELRASVLSGLGGTLWAMGRYHESFERYRRLAGQRHNEGNLYAEANARYNLELLASFLKKDGEIGEEEHRRLIGEALDVAVRSGNRGAEASVRLSLAQDQTLGLAEEIRQAEKALALARDSGHTGDALFALRLLALYRFRTDPGHPEAALRLADQAIEQARAAGDLQQIARGLIVRNQILTDAGSHDEAWTDALAALDAIESIRDLQRDDLVKARVMTPWTFFYYRASGRLLGEDGSSATPQDLDRAFRIIERLRARVLLDALDAAGATPAPDLGSALHRERSGLLERIASVQKRLMSPALPPAERENDLTELDRLEAQEMTVRDRIVRADPAFAALRRPELPTLDELRESLAPDQAMLVYQISRRKISAEAAYNDGGSWVFVVTRDRVTVHPLPDEEELDEPISIFLGMLERRDASEQEGAARLYRELVNAAIEDLPGAVRRLVIVPDKTLHRLPFEALRAAAEEASLAARYEISVAPSAAIWLRLRRGDAGGAAIPALIFADPGRPGVAPAARERDRAVASGDAAGPLPQARQEARAVARYLGGGSEAFVGDRASESLLKKADLSRYRILHFAAHALLDEERPERSALLLAPGSEAEDGLLQIREVAGLNLKGRVVVLSACRTSAGVLLRGEGVMSLARAFFQAGARAVVGSLWRLRDDEARTLVSAFYRHLAAGASVGAALAASRRDLIRAGAPAAAWAGLIVLGDAEAIPLPGGRAALLPAWWPWAALVLLAALAGALRFMGRSRQTAAPPPRPPRSARSSR